MVFQHLLSLPLDDPDHLPSTIARLLVKAAVHAPPAESGQPKQQLELLLIDPADTHGCLVILTTGRESPGDVLDLAHQVVFLSEGQLDQRAALWQHVRTMKLEPSGRLRVIQERLKARCEEVEEQPPTLIEMSANVKIGYVFFVDLIGFLALKITFFMI